MYGKPFVDGNCVGLSRKLGRAVGGTGDGV